ncbi:MAG: DUF1080 domain-containing protein [Armatimonadetes bacterium]|nr:DUF1080 domain-containing protein [Armatimonadota bacterium]
MQRAKMPAVFLLLWASMSWAQAAGEPVTYQPRLDKDGYEVLMDGKDLNAWRLAGQEEVWKINEQGELYPAKGGGTLYTKLRYCDYVLELDVKVAGGKKSNSGIHLRVHDMNDPVNTGLEIQVLDDADYGVKWDAGNANGALYDLVRPAVEASSPVGEWNHFVITVNGADMKVQLNGKEIIVADLAKWTEAHNNPDGSHNKFAYAISALPREGFLGLQNYNGAPVWYRNMRLKPLSDRKPAFKGTEPIADVLAK